MYFVAQSHISQILIPYLLGFLGVYYRNLLLPLNRSICSSKRKAEKRNTMIGTSQWTAQSSRNYGILSFKRRSVLDAWSSNIITDKIRCTIVFPLRARATFGGVLLQVKSLPWKTFVFSSVFSPVSECSTPVFLSVSGHQCQQYRAESTSQSKSSSTASSKPSEPLSQISWPVWLPSSLTSLSETRRLIS